MNFLICVFLNFSYLKSENYKKFYINDLIEIDDKIFKKFRKKEINGLIYRKFKIKGLESKEYFVGRYLEGGKNGEWTRRWNNGKIKSSGSYINTIKNGLWEIYNQKGEKIYQLYYENGILTYIVNLNLLTP